ncbi:hypothetical protein [Actinokineospora sp.]|uniref:hypothetical protein n=1 Tax=Actinokineospora sp. TaxID=1872133 RepID=UPI003D6A7B82
MAAELDDATIAMITAIEEPSWERNTWANDADVIKFIDAVHTVMSAQPHGTAETVFTEVAKSAEKENLDGTWPELARLKLNDYSAFELAKVGKDLESATAEQVLETFRARVTAAAGPASADVTESPKIYVADDGRHYTVEVGPDSVERSVWIDSGPEGTQDSGITFHDKVLAALAAFREEHSADYEATPRDELVKKAVKLARTRAATNARPIS